MKLEYVTSAVPTAHAEDRVEEVLQRLRGQRFESMNAVCVIDNNQKFLGAVPLVDIFAAREGIILSELMPERSPVVSPDVDREDAASLAIKEELAIVPVVDKHDQLLGVFPPRAIMSTLREEHFEDLHHLAGIWQHSDKARAALQSPPLQRALYRLPWLLVGLIGSLIAARVVAQFEQILQAQIAVAFFIPMIVYLADAVGTQSEAVAVRGLSLTDTGIRHLLVGEASVGIIMGCALSVVAGLFAFVSFGDPELALTIAISLLCACAVATSVGLYLPWLFSKAGSDPALASGPIATIIQDVLSLLIYFATASILLQN